MFQGYRVRKPGEGSGPRQAVGPQSLILLTNRLMVPLLNLVCFRTFLLVWTPFIAIPPKR